MLLQGNENVDAVFVMSINYLRIYNYHFARFKRLIFFFFLRKVSDTNLTGNRSSYTLHIASTIAPPDELKHIECGGDSLRKPTLHNS